MDTNERVRKLIAEECNVSSEHVLPSDSLENLGCDSIKAISIMFRLEEEFSIDLGRDLQPDLTVKDIAEAIHMMTFGE